MTDEADGEREAEEPSRPDRDAEMRQRLILGLLFGHMMQRRSDMDRRRRREEEEEEEEAAEGERPPIRLLVLKEGEQEGDGAVICRFCLDSHQESRFIAPCGCTGSSEYVHISCLRQWQTQQQAQQQLQRRSHRCQVCMKLYSLPPPKLKSNLVQPGSLLVFAEQQHEQHGSSIQRSVFYQSVILMLQLEPAPVGVIINKRQNEPNDHPEDHRSSDATSSASTGSSDDKGIVRWRRGGPVCGGRLGIYRYIMLHTMSEPTQRTQLPLQSVLVLMNHDGSDDDRKLWCLSGRNSASASSQNGNAGSDGGTSAPAPTAGMVPIPAIMERREVQTSLNALLAGLMATTTRSGTTRHLESNEDSKEVQQQQQRNQREKEGGEERAGREDGAPLPSAIVFTGYCKWSKRQLDGELLRGSWDLLPRATVSDIFYGDDGDRASGEDGDGQNETTHPSLWHRLRESDRLLPKTAWFEDFGADEENLIGQTKAA